MNRQYNDTDQRRIETLPYEFWQLLRCMPAMRKPSATELRQLNWCEAATLCQELGGCGHYAYDSWKRVATNCGFMIRQGKLHIGHILAVIHQRTRCRIAASRTR